MILRGPPFLSDGDLVLEPVPKGAPFPRLALKAPEGGASEQALEMVARDVAGGPIVALISLGPLDWTRRTAGLTARGDVSARMIALVVRYAFDELNLERVDTDPVQGALVDILTEVGFVSAGDRWSRLKPPS